MVRKRVHGQTSVSDIRSVVGWSSLQRIGHVDVDDEYECCVHEEDRDVDIGKSANDDDDVDNDILMIQ